MHDNGALDDAYERLHQTGPEFRGWLSNHGPMAADAILRLGHQEALQEWVQGYAQKLEAPPAARWPIDADEWREPLGDSSRLGDWCALLAREVHAEPWEAVLGRWWPRLLPGAAASATHGLIRTGHAVRALRDHVTGPRLDELAQALGYWAARWQPVPGPRPPRGTSAVGVALDAIPTAAVPGGVRTRLAHLPLIAAWSGALSALQPPIQPSEVPAALTDLVDHAVTRYGRWAHGDPIMLVHAATAPRAAALVLPALPPELWRDTYDAAWTVTAAISAAYRPTSPAPPLTAAERSTDSIEAVIERAVTGGDEHAIKFTEVAQESHLRGNTTAAASAARAVALIAGSD